MSEMAVASDLSGVRRPVAPPPTSMIETAPRIDDEVMPSKDGAITRLI